MPTNRIDWCGNFLSAKMHFGTDGERFWWTDPATKERRYYSSKEQWAYVYRGTCEFSGENPDDLPKPIEGDTHDPQTGQAG